MYELFRDLIEKCEVGLRIDESGWHLSAKGALGVATLLIIAIVFSVVR